MEKKASSLAKVTQPLLARYYPRKRVYEQLERAGEYPVNWVAGPAGSGKTTLVNSFAKEQNYQCLWYQIDEGDTDPATFFYYMREAAHNISSQMPGSLPLLTPEYQAGLMVFTLRWFEQLFECIPEDAILVFDNYQEVPEQSLFHAVIAKGMSVIPGGRRVVFISRKMPPSEFSRLDASRQMAIIGWNDLRLDPEETAGIAELLAPGYFSDKKIHDFHYLIGGWAAGVVLMVQKSRMEGADPHVFFSQSPEAVFDYFVSESFKTLHEPVQEFLLKSAYLPRMSVKLAEELTGNADAKKILSALRRYNYFVERRFHNDAVYSYHPLFRQFLLDRAKDKYSQEEIIGLSSAAAILLERDGQVEDALNLVKEAGGWDTMILFIMQHAKEMIDQGRHRTLEQWITTIPQETVSTSPWLLFWLGSSRFPFDPIASKEHFKEAYAQFKKQNDTVGFFLSWAGIANAIIFGSTYFGCLNGLLEDLEERRPELDRMQSDEIRSIVVATTFNILVFLHPERVESEGWAENALNLARRVGDVDAIIQTHFFGIYHHISSGRMQKAAECITALNKYVNGLSMQGMRHLTVMFANIMYNTYAGLHEECIDLTEKALEIAESSGIHLWNIPILTMAAMSCQDVGKYENASRYLDLLSKREDEPRPSLQSLAFAVRSRQALISGDLKDALSLANHGLQLARETNMPLHIGLLDICIAWCHYLAGETSQALELISRIDVIEKKTTVKFIGSRLIEALIAFEQGDDAKGFACLEKGLSTCREYGLHTSLFDHPSSMASLCARALEVGIEIEFVKDILNKRNLMPDEAPLTLEAWPWSIKIYTMGRFEIIKDGEPIHFARKAQKMPLELLKALVSAGGSPMGDTHIADILWPAAEGDLAMKSLATTLHRLRKLLGDHEAVQVQGGTLSLNKNLCWVDAWAFESVLNKADDLWKKAHGKEMNNAACEMTARALELYRGPFFEEEVWNPDVVSMGERMKERYFRSLYQLSDHLLERGQWERARMYLEAGLALDDCIEGCYRRLMACLVPLGKKTEALAVFKRCKRVLEAKLQTAPSPQTEDFAKSIRLEAG